ncbi:hypothetical protein [Bartonella florencae]|uniref:hypothetical protein n=1 Tax=Bartonella florencae TaxID=928210 RepID=UPI0005578964|nr:hypothetical protein [Bartonella florencae]
MKREITFFMILTIVLSGCASLSGPKEPPRCNGKHTRPLNKDKWYFYNKDVIFQEKNAKPLTTPIILNTLENEKATADVTLKAASLNSINQETFSDKTVEDRREK